MTSAYGNMSNSVRNRNFYNEAWRVVAWNATARSGEHDFSEQAKANQFKLVKEECEELFDAAKANDRVEMLDAICDIFVVASYAVFLESKGSRGYDSLLSRLSFREPQKSDNHLSLLELDDYLYNQKSVNYIYQWAVKALCVFDANTMGGLLEVLSSNDSKFPRLTELVDAQREEMYLGKDGSDPIEIESQRLNEEHKGRYEGITGNQINTNSSELDGRVVFRDSNNKIMKPLTFRPAALLKFV